MLTPFSEEALRQDLESLANRPATSGLVDAAGRAICAEARFEFEQTVQRMAYLAHLGQQAND